MLFRFVVYSLLAMLICVLRRAKLKRVTTDEQERVRRSRALPEDFDFIQTLQPTLREGRPLYEFTLAEPLIFRGGISQRPSLRLGTSHLSMGSSTMGLIFTNNAPTAVSAIGSAASSPASSVDEGSERSGRTVSATQSPLVISHPFTNPFGRSHSLSADSPPFQRQDQASIQNNMMRLSCQSFATTSTSNLSISKNTCGYGDLPPPQFTRTPFQTGNHQLLGRAQFPEEFSHESGNATRQHNISPLSWPVTLPYDQSQVFYPSGPDRASSYYQRTDTNIWQRSQLSPQGYQYGQKLRPHHTTEQ